MIRARKSQKGKASWLVYAGLPQQWLNKPDTFETRHNEQGLFTWLWTSCQFATVRIEAVLNPILRRSKVRLSKFHSDKLRSVRLPRHAREVVIRELSHRAGRKSLGVFQALVNRVVYRKTSSKVRLHNNGISRPDEGLARPLRNFCPNCIDVCGPRVTKGVYLPIEHECASIRVYDLQGKLIEVKAI